MPRNQQKDAGKKKLRNDTKREPSNKPESVPETQDSEEDEIVTLPGQEHCEWLLNVIRTQAKKITQELLLEEKQKSDGIIKDLKEEITSLRNEVKQCKESKLSLEKEIAKLQYARNGINSDLGKHKCYIAELKLTVDKMDQKQRENRIKIAGVPEAEQENLEKTVIKYVKNNLGVKIKSTDVDQIYRVGKKKENRKRDITVQFSSKKVRDSVYDNRKKDTNTDVKNRVYVNDDLTIHRQKLLFDARQLVKRNKLKGAWTQSGNIMILRHEGGPIPVMCHDDLREPHVDQSDITNCLTNPDYSEESLTEPSDLMSMISDL